MAHPLTKDDLESINSAMKSIRATRDVLARAKVAKIDVAIQEERLNEAEARLQAIKAGFFPAGRA